jgi:hypothetical protein
MKRHHKILIAIERLIPKLIIGGLGVGFLILLSLRFRPIRAFLAFLLLIVGAGIFGGASGAIAGWVIFLFSIVCAKIAWRLCKLGAKLIAPWRSKQSDSDLLVSYSFARSNYSSIGRLVASQLRIAAGRTFEQRLALITELENAIRSRAPNFSNQDLRDLSLLDRERQYIIDRQSWSQTRIDRVNRIEEIRRLRQFNGLNTPSSLIDRYDNLDADIQSSITELDFYSYDMHYSGDEEWDGIGDLTCEYNAQSLYLRCAVHPEAETCEGCRDYRSTAE